MTIPKLKYKPRKKTAYAKVKGQKLEGGQASRPLQLSGQEWNRKGWLTLLVGPHTTIL